MSCGIRLTALASWSRIAASSLPLAPCASIDLWCSRYPDEALVVAEYKAREREARGK